MPSLYVVLHCRDCSQPTELTLDPAQPAPAAPICHICGGGRWQIMLGRVLRSSTAKGAA
jgi:hypothetical protein